MGRPVLGLVAAVGGMDGLNGVRRPPLDTGRVRLEAKTVAPTLGGGLGRHIDPDAGVVEVTRAPVDEVAGVGPTPRPRPHVRLLAPGGTPPVAATLPAPHIGVHSKAITRLGPPRGDDEGGLAAAKGEVAVADAVAQTEARRVPGRDRVTKPRDDPCPYSVAAEGQTGLPGHTAPLVLRGGPT